MDQIAADFSQDTWLSYPVIIARLIGAIVLGALIGLEREFRAQPAGLRTHILVALASALIAILSIESVHLVGFRDDQARIDPLRAIEAVTGGVAFLAAGMIVFSGGQVKGLTTGAGMWLAGGVGLSVGLGYWFIALCTTIACLVVLTLIGKISARISPESRTPESDGDQAN